MIEQISFPYPWWFLFFCMLAGFAYAFILYKKESRFEEAGKWLKYAMAGLRALAVFIICLLLLGPIIKSIKEDQKEPIIVIAQDVSHSIGLANPAHQKEIIDENISQLTKKLSSDYQVAKLDFADKTVADTSLKVSPNSTNLSNAVEYIYDNYADQNIGAIILYSDGIYNEGGHPAYAPVKFSSSMYTVALGDTSIRKDLWIKNVLSNRIAYLGDQFAVQVDIAASSCKGAASRLKLEKSDGSGRKLVSEQNITINENDFFTTVQFMADASQTGVVKYTVSLSPVSGEVSAENNKKEIYIEVLDGRQNVLILGNAPNPDLSALQQLISKHKNYKATTAVLGIDKPVIGDYDLVIAHNLPSDQHDFSAEMAIINNKKIPTVFIAGTQINQSRFNLMQDVLKIKGNSRTNEEAEITLNSSFDLFTLSEELKGKITRFPPLINLFGNYEAGAAAKVLFHQKIKKIPTRYPLIAFSEANGNRNAVISGEGIWKWKIQEYAQYQNNSTCEELINKIIQLVTVKDDKRKFKVNLPKQIFKDNENVVMDAQLFNDAYEMINEPEVFLSVINESGKEFKYTFSKTNNYYVMDLGQLSAGAYSYKAMTTYKGQPQVFSGKFSVEALQLEAYDLTARHDVLAALAGKFNGKVINLDQTSSLADEILKDDRLKPTIFQTTFSQSIIHYKWLFLLILMLLSTEWFLRRYYGSY